MVFGFLLVSRGRVRTHRGGGGESAAGVLAGHEGVHALPPVVAALLPRPLLRFRDDLALQVDQQVAEFREPGAGGGDRPGGGWTAPACLWRGADRAAGAATSVGGHSYSVQSASEVLTIARSGGGALDARIEASVRRDEDEAGGRRCLLAAACVSGRFLGVQIRALEPRTTRIHRQPRVTRFESFRGFREKEAREVRFKLFWQFSFALLRGWGSESFSGRRAHRPGAPAGAPLGAMLRALATGSTRAIAATGAVAAYLCSAAAATEAGPSTSSDHQGANTIAGANRREVTPLDAPIAAAYPTAANKATAQWRVYTDIARDLSSRGEHEEAGKYLRRALKEAQEGFGKDDPHVAAARNNLAELYRLQKRWDEAERLYEDAARALERHFGPSHPATATAVHNLGGCKLARGDFRGASPRTPTPRRRKPRRSARRTRTTRRRCSTWPRPSARGRTRGVRVAAGTQRPGVGRVRPGDDGANLRRIERLAQVRGDVLGDHVSAERLRARVLEARERSSRAHGDHEPGKRGFVRDLAMSQRRAAVASALEARARSLEALGRRSDAIESLRSAVRIHETRLSDAMGLGIPRELLDADDIRPAGLVRGVIELVEQTVNPMFGWARPGAAAEAAAANMRLQLASARLTLADVALREEEARGDEAMAAMATEQLARAVGSLQPLAAAAAAALSSRPPPTTTRDRRGPRVARTGTTGTGPSPRTFAGARSRRLPSVTSRRSSSSRGRLERSRRSSRLERYLAGEPASGRITSEMRWNGCTRRTARTYEAWWRRLRPGRC